MKSLLEKVESYLDQDGLSYHRFSSPRDERVTTITFDARNCIIWCRILTDEDAHHIRIVASSGLKVPQDMLERVYEFICRTNFALRVGCLWLDPNSRELTCVQSLALEDAELSHGLFRGMVESTVGYYDHVLPGLVGVIYAGASPSAPEFTSDAPSPEEMRQVLSKLLGDETNHPSSDGDSQGEQGRTPEIVPLKRKRGRPRKKPIVE